MKISFIVPVYNAEGYLDECIKSIVNQSYTNLQIILIDDGSVDNSLCKCMEWKVRDHRIEVVHQENKGAAAARNAGLELATGEWVAFVDADDKIAVDYVEVFEHYLITDEYEICCGNEKKQGSSNTADAQILNKEQLRQYERGLLNKYAVRTAPHLTSACAKLYRRSLLEKRNIRFPEELTKSEDAFFNQMVFHYASRGVYIRKEIYVYQYHGDSASQKYDCSSIENYKKHLELLKSFLCEEGIYEEMETDYQIRIVYHFFYCISTCFCHKDNIEKYSLRRQEFMLQRESRPFADAFASADASGLSVKERILFYAVKYRWFGVTDCIFKLQRLLGVRK